MLIHIWNKPNSVGPETNQTFMIIYITSDCIYTYYTNMYVNVFPEELYLCDIFKTKDKVYIKYFSKFSL